VVQTDRDQQTVEERKHARTDRTQFLDVLTEVHQTVKITGQTYIMMNATTIIRNEVSDRHQTATAKEGSAFRQLYAAEAVYSSAR
jgi:predicted component of type VI protein secretion system